MNIKQTNERQHTHGDKKTAFGWRKATKWEDGRESKKWVGFALISNLESSTFVEVLQDIISGWREYGSGSKAGSSFEG